MNRKENREVLVKGMQTLTKLGTLKLAFKLDPTDRREAVREDVKQVLVSI
jgi:hypothetical protein